MSIGVAELAIILGFCACVTIPGLMAIIVYFVKKDRDSGD